MSKLQPIIGPDGKPAHVNNRDIIAAEHVNYGVTWHRQAVEGFQREHDPATGAHAFPRYCKGALYLTPRITQQGTFFDIDDASCWGRVTQGDNPNLFEATGSYTQATRTWAITITCQEDMTRTAILGLGSGGRGVETEISWGPNPPPAPPAYMHIVLRGYHIPGVGEAEWTRRLSVLFYGEEP